MSVEVQLFSNDEIYTNTNISPVILPAESTTSAELNKLLHFQLKKLNLENKTFNFYINSKRLTTSLQSFIEANKLKTTNEFVMNIEFVETFNDPIQISSKVHDDWISCIKLSKNKYEKFSARILTGSFDGCCRVFGSDGNLMRVIDVNPNENNVPIKCIDWMPEFSESAFIAGTGSGKLYSFNLEGEKCFEFSGNSDKSFTSVAVSDLTVAAGGWDTNIRTWSTNPSEFETVSIECYSSRKKKQKKTPTNQYRRVKICTSTLKGHTGPLTSLVFDPSNSSNVVSGSLDNSVRIWDITRESNFQTIVMIKIFNSIQKSTHAVMCIDFANFGNFIIASGCTDGTIRLLDPRSKG